MTLEMNGKEKKESDEKRNELRDCKKRKGTRNITEKNKKEVKANG